MTKPFCYIVFKDYSFLEKKTKSYQLVIYAYKQANIITLFKEFNFTRIIINNSMLSVKLDKVLKHSYNKNAKKLC